MQNTKNINFCAFLRMKNIHPDKVEIIRKGKASYHFNFDDQQWIDLKQEFNRSEFIEYASCLNAIKDLAY